MLFYRLNKCLGLACSNHYSTNRGVAALLIVIIVLVSLIGIATTVFYQSRSGLKISSQDKLHRELLSVATGETMHTADWIKNWFKNRPDSAVDPLVFMSDPNPGGKPQYQTGGLFHHISVDYSKPNQKQRAHKLLESFADVFNDPSTYYSGFSNPDPDLTGTCSGPCGVFAKGKTDNDIQYLVWAEAQKINGKSDCIGGGSPAGPPPKKPKTAKKGGPPTSGSGKDAVACIEDITNETTTAQALRITLHGRATRSSVLDGRGSIELEVERTFWLIADEQNVDAFRTRRANACMACHAFIYGDFSMPGGNNLMPISRHGASLRVTGRGRFGANNLLRFWPDAANPTRMADCGDSQMSWHCIDHGTFKSVDTVYDNNPTEDPNGYYIDRQPYNGTIRFKTEENNSESDLMPIPDMIRNLNSSAIRNNYQNPYDTNPGSPDAYVLNNYFDLSDETKGMLDAVGKDSYIKATTPGSAEVIVDFGKRRGCTFGAADPMCSDGTLATMSKWIDPADPAKKGVTIDLNFTSTQNFGTFDRDSGLRKAIDGGHGWMSPTAGAMITGNITAEGFTYFEGDVILQNVTYTTPGKPWTIAAGGNIYVVGKVEGANNPDIQTAAGQPNDGIRFTDAEVGPNSLNLVTDGTVFIGNFNSARNWFMSGYVNDTAAPFKGTTDIPDPTTNFLDTGYFEPDYIDPVTGPATAGVWVTDSNNGRALRVDEPLRILVDSKDTSPLRPPPDEYWKTIDVVTNGWLPLGGELDPDLDNWTDNQSIYTGNPWIQGAEYLNWLKTTSGVSPADWYHNSGGTDVALDTANNPSNNPTDNRPKSSTVGASENMAVLGQVGRVDAIILANNVFANRRPYENGLNEFDDDPTDGVMPYYTNGANIAQNFDSDDDGISILGSVISRYNAYIFAPGTMAVYFNPKAMQGFSQFLPFARSVRAGEFKVVSER